MGLLYVFLFSQVNKYVKYSYTHMNTYVCCVWGNLRGQPAPWHDFIFICSLARIVLVVYFDSCHRPAWDVAFNACRNTLTFTFMSMFLCHSPPCPLGQLPVATFQLKMIYDIFAMWHKRFAAELSQLESTLNRFLNGIFQLENSWRRGILNCTTI